MLGHVSTLETARFFLSSRKSKIGAKTKTSRKKRPKTILSKFSVSILKVKAIAEKSIIPRLHRKRRVLNVVNVEPLFRSEKTLFDSLGFSEVFFQFFPILNGLFCEVRNRFLCARNRLTLLSCFHAHSSFPKKEGRIAVSVFTSSLKPRALFRKCLF